MTFILIRGPSGVGKSTIARKLAKKLPQKTAHINVDVFPHELIVDWEEIPITERLDIMYENAYFATELFLKKDYNVVIDGGFSIGEDFTLLRKFLELAKRYNKKPEVVELIASLEELINRAKKRNRLEDTENNFEIIKHRLNSFVESNLKNKILINTDKKKTEIIVLEILKRVQK